MARTVKLDSNGDLDITNGRASFLEGGRATAQLLYNRLRSFRGEWFYGKSRGVPVWEEILVHNPQPTIIEAIYFSVIRATSGVRGINKLDLDFDPVTRTLIVYPFVTTTDGQQLTPSDLALGG
jgi:hypothetical protein